MRKIVIILSVLALIVVGCKPKTTSTTSTQTDTLNIQQELTQEEINQDLVQKQELEDEFNPHPLISAEGLANIAPIIKQWTDFYKLNLAQARLTEFLDSTYIYRTCLDCPPDTRDVYYQEYTPEQNTSKLISVFYSPDKQRYIDIGIFCEKINGKYYDTGEYDDCQIIEFTDRQLKHNHTLFYFGVSTGVDVVFWKNNDVFFLAGREFGYPRYFVYEYNISNQTRTHYEIVADAKNSNYLTEVVYKEKGIILDYEEYEKLKSQRNEK